MLMRRPQPGQDGSAVAIDVAHQPNLPATLVSILLVDVDLVGEEDS